MPLATCVGHGTTGVCDLGLPCCPHGRSGTNSQGCALLESDGQNVHLLTHKGSTNCAHGGTFESVEGASLMEVEGLPVTLVGDTTICQACGKSGTHSSGTSLLEIEY